MNSLFFPYLLANYPDPSRFSEALDVTLAHADTVEIGIPFSDPVADGPVIANAASHVLSNGFDLDRLFRVLQQKKSRVPIAMMCYANPILAYGITDFLKASVDCGARYLIVPDVPFEEAASWREATREHRLQWISFISLSTSERRLEHIAKAAEGFIYLLSLKGITGSKIHSPDQISNQAMRIRQHTKVPLALGFGIKSAEDTAPYREVIDAFIVGSKIIECINSNGVEHLHEFLETFRRSL
jgi:tryptophan synthase alpha chain